MHKIKIQSLVIAFSMLSLTTYAQNEISQKGYSSLGVGIGLPYGGIGGKFGINVVNQLNLFAGLGYNLHAVGYNFGILYSIPSSTRGAFYLTAMYGANASSKVKGAPEYNATFTGATIGIGVRIATAKNTNNHLDFGILIPFRSDEYKEMIEAIENDSRIEDFTEPWPILFTIGYNFGN